MFWAWSLINLIKNIEVEHVSMFLLLMVFILFMKLGQWQINEIDETEEQFKNSPYLEEIDSVNMIISKVLSNRGLVHIFGTKGEKILTCCYANDNYGKNFLGQVIYEGDTIVKRKHSKKVYLYKKDYMLN